MNVDEGRGALSGLLDEAKVMQLATTQADGSPWMCTVWFAWMPEPDRLFFTSRRSRTHSQHVDERSSVAGAIVGPVPAALGDPVLGTTFTGQTEIVGSDEYSEARRAFVRRWPAADGGLAESAPDPDSGASLLYVVRVRSWFLHDEVNSPSAPRFELLGT